MKIPKYTYVVPVCCQFLIFFYFLHVFLPFGTVHCSLPPNFSRKHTRLFCASVFVWAVLSAWISTQSIVLLIPSISQDSARTSLLTWCLQGFSVREFIVCSYCCRLQLSVCHSSASLNHKLFEGKDFLVLYIHHNARSIVNPWSLCYKNAQMNELLGLLCSPVQTVICLS